MDRIENILQRLQGIYFDKRAKTEIDLDLMLDYTRVLYADILEWKQTISPKNTESLRDSSPTIIQEDSKPATVQDDAKATETKVFSKEDHPIPLKEEVSSNQNPEPKKIEEIAPVQSSIKEIKEESQTAVQEPSEKGENVYEESPTSKMEAEKPEETPQSPVKAKSEDSLVLNTSKINPDQNEDAANLVASVEDQIVFEPKGKEADEAPEEFFYRQRPVLSFELPKVQDEPEDNLKSISPKNLDSVEKQKPPQAPISNAVVKDNKESNEPVSKKAQRSPLFPEFEDSLFVKKTALKTVDIRKNIGLNDRYLFLNELFNQNKSAYETALDQFNQMNTFDEAISFANDLATKHNWIKDEETTQSFYTALSKHFSDK